MRGLPDGQDAKAVLWGAVLSIATLLYAQSVPAFKSSLGKDPEALAVGQVIEDLIQADEEKNLAKVLSIYAPDAVLIKPTGANVVGIEAIRAHYEALFQSGDLAIETRIEDIAVSADLAVARGVNDVTFTPGTQGEPSRVLSKYLMSLRRDSDHGWRIVNLMWSNQQGEHP